MLNTRKLVKNGKKTVTVGFHSLLEIDTFTPETVGGAWSWIRQHCNCTVAFFSLLFIKARSTLVRSRFTNWIAAGRFCVGTARPSCPGSSNAAIFSPCRGSTEAVTCLPGNTQPVSSQKKKKKKSSFLPLSPLLNLPEMCLSWRWICVFFHNKDHLIQITCWGFVDFWTLLTSPLFKVVTKKGRSADPHLDPWAIHSEGAERWFNLNYWVFMYQDRNSISSSCLGFHDQVFRTYLVGC